MTAQTYLSGGEALYARWTRALNERWSPHRHANIFAVATEQPSSKPVAWSFLTKAERDSWDELAEQLGIGP